jgi:class 3 adenylate cyclase
MFCDLVGSTSLSGRLDPEDMRDVITGFQDKCREAIRRYEGFIARYMGDGMLVYFGYPRAHEEDAERAVRAGLGIVASMAELNRGVGRSFRLELAVRVGIATGPVVVGDIIGEGASEESAVVGETPNLAARLQGVAQPNQVAIGGVTRELVGERFEYRDLGSHSLKGISAPVRVWSVVRERDFESRYRGAATARRLPLVGRREELGLMRRAWDGSKAGHGQAVLISGEAGIEKKSRLLESLREEIADQHYIRISIRASPYHTASPFHPVIEHLKRAMQWQDDDDAEARLDKLERTLARQPSLRLDDVVPLYAALLSLPLPEGRYPASWI